MNVLQSLIELDQEIFIFLNSFTSNFMDHIFWLISSKTIWIPLYAALAFVILKKQWKTGIITLLFIGILIVLCDQISTEVFKHGIKRFRPTHDPFIGNLVDTVGNYRGGKYGFVSSHATNVFGLAVFTSLLFKSKFFNYFIFSWAILVSYSRIYLGVHYPYDIIGGAILGILIGWCIFKLYSKSLNFRFSNIQLNLPVWYFPQQYITKDLNLIYTILATLFCCIILGSKTLLKI
ncbi:phospholipid phosphatase [Marinifilum breve]|uniref:Phospholipid phosphatase n=1 Tax=Marinifilum breve TaxID=2184082 RepID=A0A2V3ZV41_9BACT|nr:phosphatase PAP2 family protein [Marinifilum breve]PXX98927.1 phospholipid phosphatase [Marinifilum breve]